MRKWISISAFLIIILFLVNGCASLSNSPIITSLKADAVILSPSGSTLIRCSASERDGGNLSYNWSASGGNLTTQVLSGGNSAVLWKAPDHGSKYTITVRVNDNHGNQDVGDIVLIVNQPPSITSVETNNVEGNWVKPSRSLRFECQAEDHDGDKLTYAWEASGGHISGRGPVATWTAPEVVGGYQIAVAVSDGRGADAKSSLNIAVAPSRPVGLPVIESLTVTPQNPNCMKGEQIRIGKSCELKCVASDPDGYALSYAWVANGGELSGQGPAVNWTAPNNAGTFVITVMVSNTIGSMVSGNKTFSVMAGCGCSWPGC